MSAIGRYFDLLLRRKRAYVKVFKSDKRAGELVLSDLRALCPTDPTKGTGKQINDKKVYINIGKRQILSHIMAMLELTDEDINLMAKHNNLEKINGRNESDE